MQGKVCGARLLLAARATMRQCALAACWQPLITLLALGIPPVAGMMPGMEMMQGMMMMPGMMPFGGMPGARLLHSLPHGQPGVADQKPELCKRAGGLLPSHKE